MHRLLQVAFAGAAPPSRILHISFSHGLCSLWPGMHTQPKSRNNDSFLRTAVPEWSDRPVYTPKGTAAREEEKGSEGQTKA